ncbi:MAG: hypothetical protein KBA40_04435 [Candidatus Peribacteraceae bacterium]|nr:hypothetical protein [Candidatus Peribacteraceae bacterium]
MKTSLKTFLADLYEIDPSLQTHEAELIPLVEKLLASDPAQEPDTEFVKRLRMQLKERAADLSTPQSAGFQKWLFALGGAVTAAVILPVAFIAMNQYDRPVTSMTESDGSALFSYSISEEGKNAFGSLSDIAGEGTMTRNQSGGGGGNPPVPSMAPEVMSDTAMGIGGGTDAKMIAPYPMTKYNYVYAGTLPELTSTVSVYKRNTSRKNVSFSAIGSSLNLGNIDLTSFDGMSLENVSFAQNKQYGYQLNVNLRDSSVSIDAQWDMWPMSKCQTEACFQAERVKLTDIPSDDQLIAIAKDFVADHKIDVSHYGEPEVDMLWKRDYDRAPSKADAWIPDQIRVIYPLVIDGNEVSDQGGQPFGISVSVHVKTRRVMNVYGIMSRDYSKSDYAGVSDAKQVTDYLANLDNYAWMPESDMKDVKTATITLGEPVMGYSVYYTYKDNVNQELLIPVLTFPVTNVEGGDPYFYRSTVMVPLAADMLKDQMNGGMPMPVDGVRAM